MGIERTGRSADFKWGQDGGIDLQKALFVQVSADLFQDLAAFDKSILDFGVDDQVNIALAVAGFTVSQAMELFGQRQQTLGNQGQLMHAHAQFAHFGAEHFAGAGNDIAHIHLFECGVCFIAQQITLDEDLDITFRIAQVGKAGLAHNALGHHTASQADHTAGIFLSGQIFIFFFQISRESILLAFGDGKRVVAGGLEVGQLLTPYCRFRCGVLGGGLLVLFHGAGSFPVLYPGVISGCG